MSLQIGVIESKNRLYFPFCNVDVGSLQFKRSELRGCMSLLALLMKQRLMEGSIAKQRCNLFIDMRYYRENALYLCIARKDNASTI